MSGSFTFARFFDQLIAWESLFALAVLAAFAVGAFVLRIFLNVAAGRLESRGPDSIVPDMLKAARLPAILFVLILGIYLAIISLPIEGSGWRNVATQAWKIGIVLVMVQAGASAVDFFVKWYIRVVAPKTETALDDMLLPQVRRFLLVVVYGIGGLIVLDTLGITISPLLGGLGITGLAVALALQPTLGNFFAGTYVLSDGALNVGDFIELSGGPSGYVVEVGWRSTKIQTVYNNLVVIPNSVLADTIVTNYQAPSNAISVLVHCGVSYDSDLKQVHDIALECSRKAVMESPAATDFDPIVNFNNFGDSNIDFYVFAQANDRIAGFALKSDIIKEMHARFTEEGIEINYPVRKLVYEGGQKLPVEITGVRSPGEGA